MYDFFANIITLFSDNANRKRSPTKTARPARHQNARSQRNPWNQYLGETTSLDFRGRYYTLEQLTYHLKIDGWKMNFLFKIQGTC